jgi:lysophospholipase L1-like esterase
LSLKCLEVFLLKKFSCIVFLVLLVEFSLQLTSYFLTSHQPTYKGSKKVILVLGESTSDDNYAQNNKAWPSYLNELLLNENYPYEIINKARSSFTTNTIVHELDSWLGEFKPTITISMIGNNDSNNWIVEDNFLKHIRLYKVFLWLENSFKSRFTYHPVNENPDSGNEAQLEFQTSKKILPLIPPVGKDGENKIKLQDALKHLENSMKDKIFIKGALERYSWLAVELGEKAKCRQAITNYLSIGGVLSYVELMSAQFCFGEKEGDENVINSNESNLIFKMMVNAPAINYSRIHKRILKSGSAHIIMQYPLVSIVPLRKRFQFESNTYFVENKLNFEKELKDSLYYDIFTDRIGDVFGHTTAKGHHIIAYNLFEFLKKQGLITH